MSKRHRVVMASSAQKDIKKMNKQTAMRIFEKITYFVESEKPLDYAVQLSKPRDAQYRWRVGDYRVLFDEKDNTITILKVQHRRAVYRER